eukprot:742055_1
MPCKSPPHFVHENSWKADESANPAPTTEHTKKKNKCHANHHHTLSMKIHGKPMNLPIQTLPDTNKSVYLLKSIHKLLFDLHFIIQTTRQQHQQQNTPTKKKKCHANYHGLSDGV